MKRRRVIVRRTREAAQGLADRLMLEGRGVQLVAPIQDGDTAMWQVVVFYQDGEQSGLPLGVQDGPVREGA